MKTPSCPRVLLTLVAALLSAASLQAVTVVDWGGDYVTTTEPMGRTDSGFVNEGDLNGGAGQDVNGDGDTSDRVNFLALDDNTPLSPSSGYSGPSATFYGGYLLEDFGVANGQLSTFQVLEGTPDEFETLVRNVQTAMPIFWQKTDFLNGGNSNPIIADSNSSLSLTASRIVSGSFRFLLRDGSTYYLSEDAFTSSASLLSAGTANWLEYGVSDGDTALFFDPTGLTPVLGSTFTDITAAGYVFFAPDASGNALDLTGFEANLTIVPEPATFLMLLGGFGMLVVLRRRHS